MSNIQSPQPKWLNLRRERSLATKTEETRVAESFGGKRVPRSGGLAEGTWHRAAVGGDFETPTILGEHKRTEATSISLKLEWLRKISEAAARRNKTPAVVITFLTADGPEDWLVVPAADAQRLLGVDGSGDDAERTAKQGEGVRR